MYTLPDAVRLKEHVLGRWEAADKDAALVEDGGAERRRRRRRADGVETAGALAELYRADFAKDYPNLPQDKARIVLVEAGPEVFAMFKPNLREYTEKALRKRTVEVVTGEIVESISPTRVTLKSGTVIEAHTLVWGAGLQGNRARSSRSGSTCRRETASASVRSSTSQIIPSCTPSVTSPRSPMRRRTKSSLSSAPSRCSPASTPARRSPGASRARRPKPFKYHDKGTMATIGRGAAVVQMMGGRTMKGKAAQLAWGTVHLALLPTNEDRAKAVVDWAGAGLTHQRPGRITVSRKRGGGLMADATAEFFGELGGRGHEPLLQKASGTLRFDLRDGKRIERWLVAVEKGDVAVSRRNAEADCVVSTDRALFDGIASGKDERDGGDAARRDRASRATSQLLVLFQRLFPGPPRLAETATPRPATAKRQP